jgi:hypothetical protein
VLGGTGGGDWSEQAKREKASAVKTIVRNTKETRRMVHLIGGACGKCIEIPGFGK